MASTRKHTQIVKPSGSAAKRPRAAASGLFFGGTELVQQQEEEDDEGQDLFYLYDSDADDDDGYADTRPPGNRRQSKTKLKKKSGRGQTGKKAVPKADSPDYDTDDKRIIELKKAGHKDDYISSKLVEEGRGLYSANRIATRWLRLKKKVERKDEELLDDELSDWHIGEDEKLRDCVNTMNDKYEVELLKLKERTWKEVAASLAEVLGEKKYTAKACKERWESLEDGTALIPIELDGNPEARALIRVGRIAENKRRRIEQKEAAVWALGKKDRKAAERRAMLEQKDRERQAEKARKQAEKDEDERIKTEQRAGLEEKRAKQRAIEAEIKERHEAKRNERKNADAMYMHYTGKKLNGRRDENLIKGLDAESTGYGSDSDVEMREFDSEGEEGELEMPHLTDADESSVEILDSDVEVTPVKRRRPGKAAKPAVRSNRARVTLETLTNPRSIMDDNELTEVLMRRGLRRRARDESHAEVVARIAAADTIVEPAELRDLLGLYFERRKGSREVLVRRLQEYDAAASELGLQGITATDPEFKRGYEGYRGRFAHALED